MSTLTKRKLAFHQMMSDHGFEIDRWGNYSLPSLSNTDKYLHRLKVRPQVIRYEYKAPGSKTWSRISSISYSIGEAETLLQTRGYINPFPKEEKKMATFTKKELDTKVSRTTLETVLTDTYGMTKDTVDSVIGEAFTKKGKTTTWTKVVAAVPQFMEVEGDFYKDLLEDLAGTKDEKSDERSDEKEKADKPGRKTWAAGFTRDPAKTQTPIRKNSLGGQIAALADGTNMMADIVKATDGADEKRVKAQLRHIARTYGYGFTINEDETVSMIPDAEFTKPAEKKVEETKEEEE